MDRLAERQSPPEIDSRPLKKELGQIDIDYIPARFLDALPVQFRKVCRGKQKRKKPSPGHAFRK